SDTVSPISLRTAAASRFTRSSMRARTTVLVIDDLLEPQCSANTTGFNDCFGTDWRERRTGSPSQGTRVLRWRLLNSSRHAAQHRPRNPYGPHRPSRRPGPSPSCHVSAAPGASACSSARTATRFIAISWPANAASTAWRPFTYCLTPNPRSSLSRPRPRGGARARASARRAGRDREATFGGCHPREIGGPETPPQAPRKSIVQRLVEVSPVRIEPLDQLELPPSLSFLQLLFPRGSASLTSP